MKRNYFAIFIFYTSFFGGQILTLNNNQPIVGDVLQNAFTTTYATQHSVSGSGLVLDFSTLPNQGMANNSYTLPNSSEISNYVDTNLKWFNGFEHNFFYKTTANGLDISGINASNYNLNYKIKNATLYNYPVSYGYSNHDTVEGTFSIIGVPNMSSFTGIQKGNIDTFADAEGTIILPNGTFNFVRVKIIQSVNLYLQTDVGYINPQGSITNTTYNYYVSGRKFPVLTYMVINVMVNSIWYSQNLVQSQVNYDMISLNTNEVKDLDIRIYPNPSVNSINIAPFKEIKSIKIYTSDGKFITQINKGNADVSQFIKGVYLLIIEDKNGRIYRKNFIKK